VVRIFEAGALAHPRRRRCKTPGNRESNAARRAPFTGRRRAIGRLAPIFVVATRFAGAQTALPPDSSPAQVGGSHRNQRLNCRRFSQNVTSEQPLRLDESAHGSICFAAACV
jgi:hypothetical protein